jgi:hypothetical protein
VLKLQSIITCSRSTRETTPDHLIRVPNTVRTPSSSTKSTFPTEAHRGPEQASRSVTMSMQKFDEFYAKHEAAEQKAFMEKYIFFGFIFIVMWIWHLIILTNLFISHTGLSFPGTTLIL